MATRTVSKAAMSCRGALGALLLGAALLPGPAHGWWNADWSGRKLFHLDTSAAGASVTEPIGDTPVLVRLSAGSFRFDAANQDASDLRFIAADDKTPLKHHVEHYDPLLGEALVWVGIPDLKPGARTDVWLYFGNPKALAVGDARGTFDAGAALVYHFAEKSGPPQDATTWANHATSAGASADGMLIGRGLKLDGSTKVTVPAGPSLAWAAGARMTWSAWVKPAAAESTGVVFNRVDGASAFAVGLDGGKPFVQIDGPSGKKRAAAEAALPGGGWHHLAVTAGEGISLYVDGSPVARLPSALPAFSTPAEIGGEGAAPAPAAPAARGKPAPAPAKLPGFKGDLDELQISKVERPPGFIRVAAISQGTDPGKFISPGQEEESGASGTNYFSILIKSVTLDGWVVIGLLAVMSLVSWWVMVGKAGYLGKVERSNDRFTEGFRKLGSDLVEFAGVAEGTAREEKALEDSSLHRLFQIGAQEVRKRAQSRRSLSAEAIEAIRATLDAGLVRENQRLNARMVLLTIAISGGPFLGLLGTVVGVMITFAAIAAAGDVNVNAIAPGIAAALVATVAGLAVAIPALFGYNWLLGRIKNVSANMTVFVDEFVTKVAEAHAGRGERVAHPSIAAAE